MVLLSRRIKALGIKMVLTGEGADEILGGYLYFHKAPNGKEFHQETIRKVKDLYKYDLLRSNKCSMAWGLEGRFPFLDKEFVEYIMSINPEDKMVGSNDRRIEKYILRKAFDTTENPYLPQSVLWRQKE
jgi:asparagine synthase (glutamine-hydrolysing)